MAKLILLRGLPASGKSTKALEIIKEHGGAVRVNKDLLREMLHFNKFTGRNEGITQDVEMTIAGALLSGKTNVIVDDTNLNPKVVDEWRSLATSLNAKFEAVWIDTPYEECIKRDVARGLEGKRFVGKEVIINMARQYKLYTFSKREIICDIDGTLADIKHRLHYVKGSKTCGEVHPELDVYHEGGLHEVKKNWPGFFSEIANDTPRPEVLSEILALSKTHNIVLVSGRPEDYKKQTIDWLNKYEIPYETLIMRRKGDTRNDDIIKKEIFDKYFLKENVDLVIDDRPRVIAMWREQGLNVKDVGYDIDF